MDYASLPFSQFSIHCTPISVRRTPHSFPLDIAKHPRSEAEWDRGTNTRCWESFPIPFLLVFYGILPPLPRGSTILPGTGIERP
jgi:hypothetical protein